MVTMVSIDIMPSAPCSLCVLHLKLRVRLDLCKRSGWRSSVPVGWSGVVPGLFVYWPLVPVEGNRGVLVLEAKAGGQILSLTGLDR